jgi:hypothetical protein
MLINEYLLRPERKIQIKIPKKTVRQNVLQFPIKYDLFCCHAFILLYRCHFYGNDRRSVKNTFPRVYWKGIFSCLFKRSDQFDEVSAGKYCSKY